MAFSTRRVAAAFRLILALLNIIVGVWHSSLCTKYAVSQFGFELFAGHSVVKFI
jgi:hypothetical protein